MFSLRRIVVIALLLVETLFISSCMRNPSLPDSRDRKQVLEIQERHRQKILDLLEFNLQPQDIRFPICLNLPDVPESAIDVHRSLFVHDRATLDAADFSLLRTLTQIAGQVSTTVPGTTAVSIFRQFRDTQNASPGAGPGPHCDDNGTTVNDFPITCPKQEGVQALASDSEILAMIQPPNPATRTYIPLALVNRLDLAHDGWRNCGEYRMIYSFGGIDIDVGPSTGETLVIFEAVLPNPNPGCRTGCLPVMRFWKSLSSISSPSERAEKLATFFYDGLPGFSPVVHVDHYSAAGAGSGYGGSAGSGQIRTNQFLGGDPWTLKEFKTVVDCGVTPCKFEIVPTMAKVNPYGKLWDNDVALDATSPYRTRAQDFQADVLLQKSRLAGSNILDISYSVDLNHDAGQSVAQPDDNPSPPFVDNYVTELNNSTAAGFRAGLVTGSLTADQMAMRALSQSCIGCHLLAANGDIGPVSIPDGTIVNRWPRVINEGFRHIEPAPNFLPEFAGSMHYGSGRGHTISPALRDVFLPARRKFFVDQLNGDQCACVPRFLFVPERLRPKLRFTDERLREMLIPRLNALNVQAQNTGPEKIDGVLQHYQELLAERDLQIHAELMRNDIELPWSLIDKKPRMLMLNAGQNAQGNEKLEAQLRAKEVNQLIKQEPPRRTVTGSFAVH